MQQHTFKIVFLSSEKIRFATCESSARKMIHMKCQTAFSLKCKQTVNPKMFENAVCYSFAWRFEMWKKMFALNNWTRYSIWATSSEKVLSNMRKMRRFASSYSCAMFHPGLCCPLIRFVVYNDSVNGQCAVWSDCADAQFDLGLRCPHMPKDKFSQGPAHIRLHHFTANPKHYENAYSSI